MVEIAGADADNEVDLGEPGNRLCTAWSLPILRAASCSHEEASDRMELRPGDGPSLDVSDS